MGSSPTARHADQIQGLGNGPAQVTATYNAIRARLVTLVKAGTSSVRGDSLDGKIYSAIYGNTRFIRATLDILVADEAWGIDLEGYGRTRKGRPPGEVADVRDMVWEEEGKGILSWREGKRRARLFS